MTEPVPMVEVWRGAHVESVHMGHAVAVNRGGTLVAAWGDPGKFVYPRSAAKMIQAVPLVESGAFDDVRLSDRHLALATSSHNAERRHNQMVHRWLEGLGLSEGALACGPQMPRDPSVAHALIRNGRAPGRLHNYCSGKHAGFLTLAAHLGAGRDYIDPNHPVQISVRGCIEELSEEDSPDFGLDGCSAPNFRLSLIGFARALARFTGKEVSNPREKALQRISEAMSKHPEMVAGEGRACTELMRAAGHGAVVKTGAEGVFAAILPEPGIGIALKIEDGATRAAEAAIVALLAHFDAVDRDHKTAQQYLNAPILTWAGEPAGHMAVAPCFPA